jgi:hypothetical protein
MWVGYVRAARLQRQSESQESQEGVRNNGRDLPALFQILNPCSLLSLIHGPCGEHIVQHPGRLALRRMVCENEKLRKMSFIFISLCSDKDNRKWDEDTQTPNYCYHLLHLDTQIASMLHQSSQFRAYLSAMGRHIDRCQINCP